MDIKKNKKSAFCYCLLSFIFIISGCAAMNTSLEHKNLEIHSKMSNSVFLDLQHQGDKTIFVDVHNTSGIQGVDAISSSIISCLKAKGYKLASTPEDAAYLMQMNVLFVGAAKISALRSSLYGGYGGPLAGGIAGGLIGAAVDDSAGPLVGSAVGMLAGGAADLFFGSTTKNVTYSMVTDVLVIEKNAGNKKQATRVLVTANQVNLKFRDAQQQLMMATARSVAGIF